MEHILPLLVTILICISKRLFYSLSIWDWKVLDDYPLPFLLHLLSTFTLKTYIERYINIRDFCLFFFFEDFLLLLAYDESLSRCFFSIKLKSYVIKLTCKNYFYDVSLTFGLSSVNHHYNCKNKTLTKLCSPFGYVYKLLGFKSHSFFYLYFGSFNLFLDITIWTWFLVHLSKKKEILQTIETGNSFYIG